MKATATHVSKSSLSIVVADAPPREQFVTKAWKRNHNVCASAVPFSTVAVTSAVSAAVQASSTHQHAWRLKRRLRGILDNTRSSKLSTSVRALVASRWLVETRGIFARISVTEVLVEVAERQSLRRSLVIADALCFILRSHAAQDHRHVLTSVRDRKLVDIHKPSITATAMRSPVRSAPTLFRRLACAARRSSRTSPAGLHPSLVDKSARSV